jgi:hypothetical protein
MDKTMPPSTEDSRSPQRRTQDERIAAEPERPPLAIPPGMAPSPLETHLAPRSRRPLAVAGVVENGLVRLLDASVKLPEQSRVIIVASEEA